MRQIKITTDVAVVGAGPAGSMAAALLARNGQRVALIDRADDGRPRIGETLPAAADRILRQLRLPAPSTNGHHRKIRGTLSSWDGPPILQDTLLSPEGPDWRLDRPAFDYDLRCAAINAGAFPVSDLVRRIERTTKHWRLTLEDDQIIEASWVVDATGRRAVVARAVGAVVRRAGPPLIAIWAIGKASNKAPVSANSDRTLIDATPEGWWYAASLPDGSTVAAFHCATATAARLSRDPVAWHRALRKTALIAKQINLDRFDWIVPVTCNARSSATEPPAGDGWIACGDAALAFDPLASQGLLNALATAKMAAQALQETDPRRAAVDYIHTLAEIGQIAEDRGKALYAQAMNRFGTDFWAEQARASSPSTARYQAALPKTQ